MKLEALFFRINRLFSISVALIALIVTFVFLMLVFKISINSPDLDIESPKVSYAEYKEQLKQEFEQKRATNQSQSRVTPAASAQKAPAPTKRNTKYDELTDKIYRNINTYANKVGAGTAKEDMLKSYLVRHAAAFDKKGANLGIGFLIGLEAETGQLASDASYNLQFDTADTRRVDWEYFIQFFIIEYESRLNIELGQIQAEKSRIAGEKATIYDKLTIAGAVFVVFFLFTMMLALLKIEFNTRQVIARVEAK